MIGNFCQQQEVAQDAKEDRASVKWGVWLNLTHRRIGEYHSKTLNEALKKTNHDLELTQCHIVVVETCKKKHVLPRNQIMWRETSNFDVVRAIWEFGPFGLVKGESVRVFLERKRMLA